MSNGYGWQIVGVKHNLGEGTDKATGKPFSYDSFKISLGKIISENGVGVDINDKKCFLKISNKPDKIAQYLGRDMLPEEIIALCGSSCQPVFSEYGEIVQLVVG